MIDPHAYAQSYPPGSSFILTRHNLQAATDRDFDDAVRPLVAAGGGAGFVVTEAITGHGELFELVYCDRS